MAHAHVERKSFTTLFVLALRWRELVVAPLRADVASRRPLSDISFNGYTSHLIVNGRHLLLSMKLHGIFSSGGSTLARDRSALCERCVCVREGTGWAVVARVFRNRCSVFSFLFVPPGVVGYDFLKLP